MVEFALVLPILLLVIFAIVDFGWMVFNYAQLYNALREGTRYGSVPGFTTPLQYQDCDGIRKKIANLAGFSGIKYDSTVPGSSPAQPSIDITYDDGRPNPIPGTTSDSQSTTATCPLNGTISVYNGSTSPQYVPPTGGHVRTSTTPVENGDRINIHVRVTVNFLTPFIRTIAPSGVTFDLKASRSVFPDGIAD